jgi:UDP-3-O-[3-hydroxymyristoyl] glucosamine N-acyltransferase
VKTVTLRDLTSFLRGDLEGDPNQRVSGVGPLDTAGPDQVSFLSNPRYEPTLQTSRAGGVIVSRECRGADLNLIRVDDPYLGFAMAMDMLYGKPYASVGVSDKAFVHADAIIGEQPSIHPFAAVQADARIGDRVTLMPGVCVGPGAVVGDDTILHPNVVLEWGVRVGRCVIIHSGTVIGSDGFGYARKGKAHYKIIHAGTVRIEDGVEIGAGCTIDRAVLGETVIGEGSKLDNLAHVAHNVQVGRNCLLLGQIGIAGSTELGDNVTMAGQSGVTGHVKVGSGAIIMGGAGVVRSLPEGAKVAGFPAVEVGQWRRTVALLGKLDDLRKRISRLESELKRFSAKDREEERD